MRLSDRIEGVAESRTAQFTSLLAERVVKGMPVINLAVGEPEHEAPPAVLAATKKALDDGKTRYSPVQGIKALKSRLSEQFEGYGEENIIISNGSKHSLYAIFQSICNPLDEVVVPRPYWVSFSEQVKLASAVPVFVDTVAHQLDCAGCVGSHHQKNPRDYRQLPQQPHGGCLSLRDLEKDCRYRRVKRPDHYFG